MQCSDVGIKGFHMVSPIYFGLICEILEKVQHDKVEQMKKVAPKWQTQPWYPFFFGDVNTKAVTEDNFVRATVKFSEENTSFISNGNLSLAAWKNTRNPLRWKEFQGILPNLAPNLGCYCKLRIGLQ